MQYHLGHSSTKGGQVLPTCISIFLVAVLSVYLVYGWIQLITINTHLHLLHTMAEDFPALCSSCCGPNEHVKMIRQPAGEECKTCTRPFTVYRWNISQTSNKSKKTIICSTCAKQRNCCQSCMLDITYGIPLEIRDTALKMAGVKTIPHSSRNREVKAIMADKAEARNEQAELAEEILTKLSQRLNLKVAAKKEVRSSADSLKNTDLSKVLAKLPFGGLLAVPEDASVTSFFMFGITESVPQYAVSDYCKLFGKIRNLTIVHRARCGYVGFTERKAAEAFAASVRGNGLNKNRSTAGLLLLEGKHPVRVSWGKPRPLGTTNDEHTKLGLVVAKVLKQLAEKDAKADGTKTEKTRGKKDERVEETVEYRAMREDIEL